MLRAGLYSGGPERALIQLRAPFSISLNFGASASGATSSAVPGGSAHLIRW
ncbi:MAG TPA: hypothetical protein VF605_16400 [Allosphingosinicella sp.]